jgi:uncharacterized protein YndB with AHSA1/START domain
LFISLLLAIRAVEGKINHKIFCRNDLFSIIAAVASIFDLRIMSKQLYTLEFPVRCSPSILYEFLSTPAGLGEWFADKVDERDNVFYFGWNGAFEKAEVVESEQDKFIRFRWLTAPKEEYFEFRIDKSEITNQTILVVKDFAEKKDIKDQSMLWDYQVKELFHRLGN